MTVVTTPLKPPTSVLVVGPDPSVRYAVARLLTLEGDVVATSAASVQQARQPRARVVVDETVLQELQHLSVADFIAAVKSLPVSEKARRRSRPPSKLKKTTMNSDLSDRELEVVRLVAEGLTNKQISILLELSDKTVKNHLSHILSKLHLSARTQVAVHALRAGLA
jgi:DNA-binding NarL/FixJ family response regulator